LKEQNFIFEFSFKAVITYQGLNLLS